MIYYHASPRDDLHLIGMKPSEPHVSICRQPWVYFGTREYVYQEYLDYAKEGTYYIYEVDLSGIDLSQVTNGQFRTSSFISPERVRLVDRRYSAPDKHPDEAGYLEWWKSMND